MATKLSTFNEALRILAQPGLGSTSGNSEEHRVLNGAWDDVIKAAYEIGNWNFLLTRAILSRHASVPVFGYQYYYTLPTDFARVAEISRTGVAHDPLLRYELERGKIATDAEAVYLRYVSTNIEAITPGDWSQAFADFVGATLALRCAPKLNAANLSLADGLVKSSRVRALSIDAIQNPPAERQQGSWARAARGMRRSQEQGSF
jgi:hypothetical protein